MNITTGHITEKNGRWYAVVNLYDTNGKRHEKWRSLNLDAKKGTKTEANHRLNQILEQYNLGDQYLHEGMSRADKERNRTADMKVDVYLKEWLESYKGNITEMFSCHPVPEKRSSDRYPRTPDGTRPEPLRNPFHR